MYHKQLSNFSNKISTMEKKTQIKFKPDGCGYLEAKVGEYTLRYGARLNPKADWYLSVGYKSTIINANWVNTYNDNDCKKALLKEYERILGTVEVLGSGSPLNNEGYNVIPINPDAKYYQELELKRVSKLDMPETTDDEDIILYKGRTFYAHDSIPELTDEEIKELRGKKKDFRYVNNAESFDSGMRDYRDLLKYTLING